jgi:hypothetical protein
VQPKLRLRLIGRMAAGIFLGKDAVQRENVSSLRHSKDVYIAAKRSAPTSRKSRMTFATQID